MVDALEAFQIEVEGFRAWASVEYPPGKSRPGEWETEYGGWRALYDAFDRFVSSTSCGEWDESTTATVLYAIARDNEMEWLAKILAENPENLMCLAARAVKSPEADARWQLASTLGTLSTLTAQAESILLLFVCDEYEYVRRRALLALSAIKSPRVPELVAAAWDTGDEYQRIAALVALDHIESPLLSEYAARAEADGRESLKRYAAAIRENGTLRGFTVQGVPVTGFF